MPSPTARQSPPRKPKRTNRPARNTPSARHAPALAPPASTRPHGTHPSAPAHGPHSHTPPRARTSPHAPGSLPVQSHDSSQSPYAVDRSPANRLPGSRSYPPPSFPPAPVADENPCHNK